MFKKFSFSDLKIGDKVLTNNNKIGQVIALKSYAYLNNKFDKKANPELFENKSERPSFKIDNTRHNGVWYSVVTVIIENTETPIPTYYIEGLDFIEIREIIKPDNSLIGKLKNLISKLYGKK